MGWAFTIRKIKKFIQTKKNEAILKRKEEKSKRDQAFKDSQTQIQSLGIIEQPISFYGQTEEKQFACFYKSPLNINN